MLLGWNWCVIDDFLDGCSHWSWEIKKGSDTRENSGFA